MSKATPIPPELLRTKQETDEIVKEEQDLL